MIFYETARTRMIFVAFLGLMLTVAAKGEDINANPPHCTNVTKGTDYVYHYRFDYPVAYIHPGQKEVFQPLYCTNPPAVALGSTVVCDWAAPPQVQFTLGDDHMHVVRQDPSGRFAGNAVIWTYQLCSHNHLLPEPYISRKLNITRGGAPGDAVHTQASETTTTHVVHQDLIARVAGNVVIWTCCACSHNYLLPEH